MNNKASQVVWTQKLPLDPLSHPLTPACSDLLLLWKPLICPSAKVELDFILLFLSTTSVSKIEDIIFGRDLFSFSRYFYLERKRKAPKRQKIFSSETKFSRRQASLSTFIHPIRTNEQLFPEASFRLSSFRGSSRCLSGGPGSWASPGGQGLAVTGQNGIKRLEAPA